MAKKPDHGLPSKALGFTLIELMVVVAIVAILSAIAIPSYRQYVVTNAERDVQAKLLQLKIQLERWRASSLTYKGFMPRSIDSDGDETYAYDADNMIIYVPQGSDSTDYRYKITLVDGESTDSSLVPDNTKGLDNTTGRSWKMLAEPRNAGVTKHAHYFVLSSAGLSCQNKNVIKVDEDDCGTGQEEW